MAIEPLNDHDPLKELANHDGIPAPTGDANLIDTDYVIGQDNISGNFLFNVDIHGKVFVISSLAVVLFVVLTLALQSEVAPLFNALRDWLPRLVLHAVCRWYGHWSHVLRRVRADVALRVIDGWRDRR